MEWSACLSFMAPMFVDLVVYRAVLQKCVSVVPTACHLDNALVGHVFSGGENAVSVVHRCFHSQPHSHRHTGPCVCVCEGAMRSTPPSISVINSKHKDTNKRNLPKL